MTNIMTLQNETYYRTESLGKPEVLSCDTQCSFILTDEELYWGLANGELSEDAFIELFRRLRPLVVRMAYCYMQPMGMDEDDMCQEAMLLLWKIIMQKKYCPERGKFSSFFFKCWEVRLKHIWELFVMRNPVPFPKEWDWCFKEPLGDSVIYWSDKGKEYLEKRRLQSKRWAEKNKARALSERRA